MVKWEDGAGPLEVMKIWGSSNSRPFERVSSYSGQNNLGGEAIAPLPPVPTALQVQVLSSRAFGR